MAKLNAIRIACDEPTFEQAPKKLDEIVGGLVRGDVPIDDAIALWPRGEKLLRTGVALLVAAEGKINKPSCSPEWTPGRRSS